MIKNWVPPLRVTCAIVFQPSLRDVRLCGTAPPALKRRAIFAMSLRDKACADLIRVARAATGQTAQGGFAVPEGQSDTSPAFQRLGGEFWIAQVPKGRLDARQRLTCSRSNSDTNHWR